MTEIWKDIAGYENEYQVSNLGRVRSLKSSIILKPQVATNGYLIACLWKDNIQKKYCIHRLVAIAFIPKPENLSDVNHLDENKENNAVSNLEWCTHLYNMNYGNVRKLISEGNKGRKITEETKKKLSLISANSRWINDGITERFVRNESIPELISDGWKLGRIRGKLGHNTADFKWVNNGVINRVVAKEKVIELLSFGWRRGQIKRKKRYRQEVA